MRTAHLALGVALLGAGFGCGGDRGHNSSVAGTIVSSGGGGLGDWTFAPADCRTGDPDDESPQLLVDLVDGAGEARLRLADDPIRGKLVVVFVPGTDKRVILDGSAGCAMLALRFDGSDHVTENDEVESGDVALDCAVLGGALRGSVQYADCATVDGD